MPSRESVMFLFYDLPNTTPREHRFYRKFVTGICREGYTRLQESVFIKLIRNRESTPKEIEKVKLLAANKGKVMLLPMSLNTFRRLETVSGMDFDFSLFCDDTIII